MRATGTLHGSGGLLRRFRTDAQAGYAVDGLLPFQYRLELLKTGFAPASLTVEVPAAAPVRIPLQLAAATSRIDVVTATPLPGAEMSVDQMPAPVQITTSADIARTTALDLSDFMKQRLDGSSSKSTTC